MSKILFLIIQLQAEYMRLNQEKVISKGRIHRRWCQQHQGHGFNF